MTEQNSSSATEQPAVAGLLERGVRLLAEMFKPHYLLHFRMGEMHGNTYINESLGAWVLRMKKSKKTLVVVGVWRISAIDYLRLKAA
jgi:hypothetical protein